MAEMRDIDEFLPDLRTYVPDCPDPLAHRFLREAAREFLKRTRLWKEWEEFEVTDPSDELLCKANDAAILEIETATLEGEPLTPQTPKWLDEHRPGWSTDTESSAPAFITQLIPDRIVLVPRATGTLRARLVLVPARDALSFPDFLLEHHAALVGKGAAGMAMMVPRTDWTNPQAGSVLINDFRNGDDGIVTIVRAAAKGQQRAPLRTKPQFF
jgi:hypothetical protein